METNLPVDMWRPQWAGLVALLRVVGRVLNTEDSKASPSARGAIEAAWKELNRTKPNPPIFWQFIEDERNSVLKNVQIQVLASTSR